MASGSGSGSAAAGKECESCQLAPGIPFCRVEWSFLCAGCAAVVHANNWIIAVPTIPNPSPYPDPNLVVQLSSDDNARASGRRGRRRSAGKAAPQPRVESVMRYKEKRKTRKFEKTVRYETRKAYAEQRPRIDGKFARPAGSGAEGTPVASDEVGLVDAHFMAMPVAGDEVGMPDAYFPATESSRGLEPHASEEVMLQIGSEELGLMDAGEEVRLL